MRPIILVLLALPILLASGCKDSPTAFVTWALDHCPEWVEDAHLRGPWLAATLRYIVEHGYVPTIPVADEPGAAVVWSGMWLAEDWLRAEGRRPFPGLMGIVLVEPPRRIIHGDDLEEFINSRER